MAGLERVLHYLERARASRFLGHIQAVQAQDWMRRQNAPKRKLRLLMGFSSVTLTWGGRHMWTSTGFHREAILANVD